MDVDTFSVTVRASNKNAIRFYKALGFRKVGSIKDYYANLEDGILFKAEERAEGKD